MRYGAKKDANHKPMVDALEKGGAGVIDMSSLGCGMPDIAVCVGSTWHLCDIKNPATGYGRRGLNPNQKAWALRWRGGPVYLLSTLDDVERLLNGRLSELKSFGGGVSVDPEDLR